MAWTQTLNHSCSIGGGRLQCWSITGDGSTYTIATGLKHPIAAWSQNEDDSTLGTGVSMTISGENVLLYSGRPITDAKIFRVFVVGA